MTAMKLLWKIVLGIFILGHSFFSSAMAEVFRSRPTPAGAFTLAVEPELTLTGDDDFTLYFHGGYGFSNGYGLHVTMGLGRSPFNDDDIHLGGRLDIPLFRTRDGKLGMFTSFGASNWGDISIENQLILFFALNSVTIYGGLDDAIRFQDNTSGDDVSFPIEVVFGVSVPVRKSVNFMIEAGIDLHKSSSYLSGGFRLFF
ncbi:MAG: hypothetical protein KDD48_06300 [Bdellovibrionales bacterium]|nr:hypothetical protein [Bdellovibrionales bacterium]